MTCYDGIVNKRKSCLQKRRTEDNTKTSIDTTKKNSEKKASSESRTNKYAEKSNMVLTARSHKYSIKYVVLIAFESLLLGGVVVLLIENNIKNSNLNRKEEIKLSNKKQELQD